jgi:hypothetical protein
MYILAVFGIGLWLLLRTQEHGLGIILIAGGGLMAIGALITKLAKK